MSIVIRVFDSEGHIGYLGFNSEGPYVTTLHDAYVYDDFEGAQYDAQRYAVEHWGVLNTCPVVEELYQRYQEIYKLVAEDPKWDIVAHCAAQPSGEYGFEAHSRGHVVSFYAKSYDEEFIIAKHDKSGEVGYNTEDGESPFHLSHIACFLAEAN